MTETERYHCAYIGRQNSHCPCLVEKRGQFCYWHDPDVSKEGPEVKAKLEAWAKMGYSMEGFCLRRADLSDIHLEAKVNGAGMDLSHADLYHANLKDAHLFEINLSYANLIKADFTRANLHWASLKRANLLGTNFLHAKLEHIEWGKRILQEVEASRMRSKGLHQDAKSLFIESEEIYRSLFRECEKQGLYEEAGNFFRKEMLMRRAQMPKLSFKWLVSCLVDISCGYGERPWRVVAFCSLVILGCACLYYFFGIQGQGQILQFSLDKGLWTALKEWTLCVYFSVVTFTTLGFGDYTPVGISRIIAAMEALAGAFIMALFVVVFVKKMTR